MPPRVPRAIAESSGPVCGSRPPAAVTSRVSEGPGLPAGVHVVVVPSALMVSTPAVKVTLPVFLGVYVPVKSLILMGVLAGIAAWLAGPVTVSAPLSAPPSLMVALGLIAPLPSSTGLEETPLCQDMVIL